MPHSQFLAHQNVVRFARPLDHLAPRAVVAPSGLDAFISRLSALDKLSAEELSLVRGLGRFTRSHLPGTEIGANAKPTMSRFVLSGWACQQRMLGDGRRQIISLLLPGDMIGSLDPQDLPTDHSVLALTQVITVDATVLVKAVASGNPAYRGLARAARLLALGETTMLRNQVVRLGRLTAYERMVHLLLELHARLKMAGLASPDTFVLPLTQEVLADVLGLSVVHINRILQQVRHDGLLETRSGQVKILDLEAMRTAADRKSGSSGCARQSWRGPAGGSPAWVRRSKPPGSKCCRSVR